MYIGIEDALYTTSDSTVIQLYKQGLDYSGYLTGTNVLSAAHAYDMNIEY